MLNTTGNTKIVELPFSLDHPDSLRKSLDRIGISFSSPESLAASLPFSRNDVSCGTETELQAVVAGKKEDVDLALTIEQSNYFANIMKRAVSGETPRRLLNELERHLSANSENIWENSWVRFPRLVLSPFANRIFEHDLLADKKHPDMGNRSDIGRFIFVNGDGKEWLRMPVSYLLKLSLADVLGSREDLPEAVWRTGERLMDHFLNDNTSPEIHSFHVVPLRPEDGMGRAIAKETAKRFLLTQLLVMYANDSFALRSHGQEAMAYCAPHPPIRQKELNNHLSDAFYRELLMSPCLSGWDEGEKKHRYMHLCHQVLSRSQLNGVAKLREAGIITNNLVVLPNLSNVSLANNSTHISIGSFKLADALADRTSSFTALHEKHLGDLVIKMTEHFLPLFVGTYSAAPYRLAFSDFHPERALGFLPHELDYTHLRMIWRRWRKKAQLSVFGHSLTPFGPEWLDRMVSSLFRLKGDFVPDFRLIDYLVCLMSTEQSPALDGRPGNADLLRKDLADMGVFDGQMSIYLLYKLREFEKMGFSGFEGRHYSLFENLEDDMGGAANLQTLVTALAFKYMAQGKLCHADIPDSPSIESERRQIFFGAAIGIPTFYVLKESGNAFLNKILQRTRHIRHSHRYPGYLRVINREYCRALVELLLEDAADLIEMLNLSETMAELMIRLEHPERHSTAGRLTRGILDSVNAKSPLSLDAREFNQAAEKYYRETLRQRHMAEAFRFLEEDCLKADLTANNATDGAREALHDVLGGESATTFLHSVKRDVLNERAPKEIVRKLIHLFLFTIWQDTVEAGKKLQRNFA